MEELGETGKSSPKTTERSIIWIIAIILFALVLFISMNPLDLGTGKGNKFDNSTMCNDGTDFGKCSPTKPYYCDDGTLLEKPSQCGCPNTFNLTSGKCISIYQKGAKNISLKYVIDGTEGRIDLAVYQGFANYTSKIPRSIEYIGSGNSPERVDFKIKSINEDVQRDALSDLVLKIQKITADRDEQAKIAISVVQNIPYGYANGTISLSRNETVIYTRYPYEVLFDNEGICGEKSQLLAFLLRELGYGTAIFYNQQENHESIGIKCPQGKSWQGSGYCFVETSGPAIISDSEIEFVGGVKIVSTPQVLKISDGLSLPKSLDEYNDAESMAKIREKISSKGEINYLDSMNLKKLREKYGLDGEYNLV